MADSLDALLDLLRRLDPRHIETHLTNLCRLAPEVAEDLLLSVDTPLKTAHDASTGKLFLCCDYNRDGDLYRLPWLNTYFPALADAEGAPFPLLELRPLEEYANDLFDVYRDLYYEGGTLSVYLWDTGDSVAVDGFAGVVLLQKNAESGNGRWSSIHVVEVEPEAGGAQANYTLTLTVILDLVEGSTDLSGLLVRQTAKVMPVGGDEGTHIANIGTLVEDVEFKLRSMLQEVYFDRTRNVLADIRTTLLVAALNATRARNAEMVLGLQSAGAAGVEEG